MSLWIALVRPEIFHGVGADPGPSVLVAVEPAEAMRLGRTTIVCPPRGLVAVGTARAEHGWHVDPCAALPFEVSRNDADCRVRQSASWRRLGLDDSLVPLLCLWTVEGSIRAYHRIEAGPAGVLFTAIGETPDADGTARCAADAAARARGWFDAARPAFNPAMTHTRWKMGLELERKFTFAGQTAGGAEAAVDTWALHRALHDELVRGAWPGFIPEFNEEFHVWDYESEMFEVLAPIEAQGYVAFIPQVDGRTTVKQKRFVIDAELRAEEIAGDRPLAPGAFEGEAIRLSGGGRVRRLPGFRRKRFDCDLESLDSGNAYGIFFDICRTTDGNNALLVQCEVEYLRTRSLAPIVAVEEEFERVCTLTRDFLLRQKTVSTEGHYSKLSFTREVALNAQSRRAAS